MPALKSIPPPPVTRSNICKLASYYAIISDDLAEKAHTLDSEPELQNAYYRMAICRAYYAAFLHAREYLDRYHNIKLYGQGGGGGGSHANLADKLLNYVDRPKAKSGLKSSTGNKLRNAKEVREDAEYSLRFPKGSNRIDHEHRNLVSEVNTIIKLLSGNETE